MRKQIAAARRLPFQRLAQRSGIYRDEHEIILSRKMAFQRAGHLIDGRKMDEAVTCIVGIAAIDAVGFGLFPFNRAYRSCRPSSWLSRRLHRFGVSPGTRGGKALDIRSGSGLNS
jgi:hypothetical protein